MTTLFDGLVVCFNTLAAQSDGSTVKIRWPGGPGVLAARLDVGGFEVLPTEENAPHCRISLADGTVLFEGRTTSTILHDAPFSAPHGLITCECDAPAAGAFGELRITLRK